MVNGIAVCAVVALVIFGAARDGAVCVQDQAAWTGVHERDDTRRVRQRS